MSGTYVRGAETMVAAVLHERVVFWFVARSERPSFSQYLFAFAGKKPRGLGWDCLPWARQRIISGSWNFDCYFNRPF